MAGVGVNEAWRECDNHQKSIKKKKKDLQRLVTCISLCDRFKTSWKSCLEYML